MLKTVRFTSKFHNDGKFNVIMEIDEKVKKVKNDMSLFIFNNLNLLLNDKKFLLVEYKRFKITEISA
jgi:hypothetical protein